MAAELEVKEGVTTLSTGDVVEFDEVEKNSDTEYKTISITNTGDENLTLSFDSTPKGFVKTNTPLGVLAPAESTTLILKTFTSIPGEFSEIQKISSNDPLVTNFELGLSFTVTSEEVPYASYEDLTLRFGSANINMWADLTGLRDINAIHEVCYSALLDATEELNSMMSGGAYEIPFASPIPRIIRKMTTIVAAKNLYYARGAFNDSFDKAIAIASNQVKTNAKEIYQGNLQIGQEKVSTHNSPII